MYKGILYTLPKPARHHDIIRLIVEKTGESYVGENEQGFIDDRGKFLRRKPARIIAERAGQILDNKAPQLSELYSENIW